MQKLKIGLIGCGTIGQALAHSIEERFANRTRLVAVCDIYEEKAVSLANSLQDKPLVLPRAQLIEKSDLVIEAASKEISAEVARDAVSKGKDVMIMSVGGLIEQTDIFDLANERGGYIYIPSGALCGLDGIKAAGAGKISKVRLTTRKPPQGLEGAPYVVRNKIDLNAIKEETVIFEGTAREAVEGFPKNVNVSATLALAGIGPEETTVRIITSPNYTRNIHEVELEGDFGKLTTRAENLPSPQNPKTSFLAVLSAIATLKRILDFVRIGT